MDQFSEDTRKSPHKNDEVQKNMVFIPVEHAAKIRIALEWVVQLQISERPILLF